jgi:hypothetical protein
MFSKCSLRGTQTLDRRLSATHKDTKTKTQRQRHKEDADHDRSILIGSCYSQV